MIDNCTLYQSDCLEVMKSIPDKSIGMILCDLPYGTTACKWDVIIPFEPLWEQYKRIIKDKGCIALFGAEPFSSALRLSNLKEYKYDWTWIKDLGTGFLNAKKQPLRITETISIFYEKQCTYNPQMRKGYKPYTCKQGNHKTDNYGKQTGAVTVNNGEWYPTNILEYSRDKDKFHPTQKAVALLEYLIKTYTVEGETVLDNCMGSGSTGVACKNTNRKFIGIEKDKYYFDIACSRIKNPEQRIKIKNNKNSLFEDD